MDIRISLGRQGLRGEGKAFALPPSKSLMAREMILKHLLRALPRYSEAQLCLLPEDIRYLYTALLQVEHGMGEVCVGESGTAMRLMTAVLAADAQCPTKLSGLGRQHQRPIAPLVEALRSLGARIDYLEREGYPPLLIYPSELRSGCVSVDASMSSQYISALMLIAPLLLGSEAYTIDASAQLVSSAPYATMTLEVMRRYGVEGEQNGGRFSFSDRALKPSRSVSASPEEDWTAASYAYLLVALYPSLDGLRLEGLAIPSLQGDGHHVPKLFAALGVASDHLSDGGIVLRRTPWGEVEALEADCRECPDIVPSLVAASVGQRRPFRLQGVAHLRLKESDRIEALAQELKALGVALEVALDEISWDGVVDIVDTPSANIWSHGDHRIAMALAPLASSLGFEAVCVEGAEAVSKSFPAYWQELEGLGFEVGIL